MASEEYYEQGGSFVDVEDHEELSFEKQELYRAKAIVANVLTAQLNGNNSRSMDKTELKLKSVLAYQIAYIFHAYKNNENPAANGVDKLNYDDDFKKLLYYAKGDARKNNEYASADVRIKERKEFLAELDLSDMIVNKIDFNPIEFYGWMKNLSENQNIPEGNALNLLNARIDVSIITSYNGFSQTHNVWNLQKIFSKLQEHFEPEIGLVEGSD